MKKIKILSNNDLDGAGSLMLMKWVFKDVAEIDYSITNLFKLKRDYEQIDVDDYSKIFILNMIPDFEVEDNVLVFSKAEFKDLTFKGEIDASITTTKLIKEFFSKELANISKQQVHLIDTIHDMYVDGGEKFESIKLNAIFSYGRNKYLKFYERFSDGLDEYTDKEKDIIRAYSKGLAKTYKDIEIFEHNKNEGVYIGLIQNMYYKHVILDLLFKKYSPKMIFLVDLTDGLISVRKNDSVTYNMQKLCDSLIQGRALKNCAGGRYTEKFLDFSKAFM